MKEVFWHGCNTKALAKQHRRGVGSWVSLLLMPCSLSAVGQRRAASVVPVFPIPEIVLLGEYAKGKGSNALAAQWGIGRGAITRRLEFLGVRRGKSEASQASSAIALLRDWTGSGDSMAQANRAWRTYDRLLSKRTDAEINANSLAVYYANHEKKKARAAAMAFIRYHAGQKLEASYRAKRALKNGVSRICRIVGSRRRMRTENFLGCTYDEGRKHIESLWQAGMTWENHGAVWEIDHKRPLDSFDLLDHEQRKLAAHFTNLQPLPKSENRAKAARWTA